MFERVIRFIQARKALAENRFEEVLRTLDDAAIATDRRAVELRKRALAGILDRGRERAARNDDSAALADVRTVLARDPEFAGAQELRQSLEEGIARRRKKADVIAQLVAQAKAAILTGRPQEAGPKIAAISDLGGKEDAATLERLVRERREQATAMIAEVRRARSQGDLSGARARLQRAADLDRDLCDVPVLHLEIARDLHGEALGRAARMARAGHAGEALSVLVPVLRAEPVLEADERVLEIRACAAEERRVRIESLMAADNVEEALIEVAAVDPTLAEASGLAGVCDRVRQIARARDLEEVGDFEAARCCFDAVARASSWPVATTSVQRVDGCVRESEQKLAEVKAAVVAGELVRAQDMLGAVLARWPRHRVALAEQDALRQSLADREARLREARAHLSAGRLLAARQAVLPLLSAGSGVDEARALAREADTRKKKVDDGIEQLRAIMTGRPKAPAEEAMIDLLARARHLESFQSDSPSLLALIGEIEAECSSLGRLRAARSALAQRDTATLCDLLEEEAGHAATFVRPDRVTAERIALAQAVLVQAEPMLGEGHPEVSGELAQRAELLLASAGVTQRDRALDVIRRSRAAIAASADLARQGLAALAAGQEATARTAYTRAAGMCTGGDDVRRLAGGLARLDAAQTEAGKLERMLDDHDFDGAHRRIRHLDPTPGALRTRIFELKRRLDQLEGVRGDFILRVEEAGEYLVLRRDRVTVGSARHGVADLPILASIQARHAEIRREFSFHGGCVDRISALTERPVLVNGQIVQSAQLKSGDRMRLGDVLEMSYRVPTAKSRSAILKLEKGFQVDGMDKVVLMKDRGKDGRVLMGSGADVHVRIEGCDQPVELFADGSGALQVRFNGTGEVDGREFRDTSVCPAGAVVRCGRIVFTVHPRPPVDGLVPPR